MGASPTASPFGFRSFLSLRGKDGTQGLAQTNHMLYTEPQSHSLDLLSYCPATLRTVKSVVQRRIAWHMQ